MPRLVEERDEVERSIERFNKDLRRHDRAAEDLAARLSFNRAWYYSPELDLVGPSKFIGYNHMTGPLYVSSGSLDGKETEPRLLRWFRQLEPGTPEAAFVRDKVEALLAPYRKELNKAARFCAPVGWRVSAKDAATRPRASQAAPGRRTIHASVTRGEAFYVAECDQLAVVTQGRTVDETLANLKEAVALHLAGEDLAAQGLAPDPVVLVTLELLPWAA